MTDRQDHEAGSRPNSRRSCGIGRSARRPPTRNWLCGRACASAADGVTFQPSSRQTRYAGLVGPHRAGSAAKLDYFLREYS
jgi:hypothetical protein